MGRDRNRKNGRELRKRNKTEYIEREMSGEGAIDMKKAPPFRHMNT